MRKSAIGLVVALCWASAAAWVAPATGATAPDSRAAAARPASSMPLAAATRKSGGEARDVGSRITRYRYELACSDCDPDPPPPPKK
jgi:hypothetical protein